MLRELCSGSGNLTSRPSGYEPDELPTALSRDIGLQIYGHFLNLQIFIAFFEKTLPYFARSVDYTRNDMISDILSFPNDFCSPLERFFTLITLSATSLPPTIERNGIAFLSA